MSGNPQESKKPVYARIRLGYHQIATHGPVSIGIDRATHKKFLVVKVPHIGEVPVPIDDVDLRNLGIEIIREMGSTYDFTEPLEEPLPPANMPPAFSQAAPPDPSSEE
jgi:hypothetical protein